MTTPATKPRGMAEEALKHELIRRNGGCWCGKQHMVCKHCGGLVVNGEASKKTNCPQRKAAE